MKALETLSADLALKVMAMIMIYQGKGFKIVDQYSEFNPLAILTGTAIKEITVADIIEEIKDDEREQEEKEIALERAKKACKRCSGTGTIAAYHHIENGICFRCGGTGIER